MVGGKDKIEKYNMITDKKFSTTVEDLCYKLPSNQLLYFLHVTILVEFALFYNHCRGLEFE